MEKKCKQWGFIKDVFCAPNSTYETLLVMMHEIVGVDPNSRVYDLRSLLNIQGKMARFTIKKDKDLHYVLRIGNEISEVYVTVEHSQQQVNQSINEKHLHEPNDQSFVQLMAFQFASTSESNFMHELIPFFKLNRCTETASE